MCESKPGPRCSNDAAKSLKRANKKLEEVNKDYIKAQRRVVRATNEARKNDDKETLAELSRAERHVLRVEKQVKAAEGKKGDKELQYFATPKGLQWLESESQSDPQAGRLLKTATDYRNTQKYLLMKLEERDSREDKIDFIKTAKQTILRNSAVKEQKLALHGSKSSIDEYEARTSLDYSRLLLEDLDDAASGLKHKKA